jgi:hypothetical protein
MTTTSILTIYAALITAIVLSIWATIDNKSRPYSLMGAVWSLGIFLVFTVLWCMSRDGYQVGDIAFMSNAIPGIILGSLVSLCVIGVNEIRIHTRGRRGNRS